MKRDDSHRIDLQIFPNHCMLVCACGWKSTTRARTEKARADRVIEMMNRHLRQGKESELEHHSHV